MARARERATSLRRPLLSLLGIAVLVLGFVLRANPLLIVLAAALVTGMAAAWAPGAGAGTLAHAATTTLLPRIHAPCTRWGGRPAARLSGGPKHSTVSASAVNSRRRQ